jgi:hypothetical protein
MSNFRVKIALLRKRYLIGKLATPEEYAPLSQVNSTGQAPVKCTFASNRYATL